MTDNIDNFNEQNQIDPQSDSANESRRASKPSGNRTVLGLLIAAAVILAILLAFLILRYRNDRAEAKQAAFENATSQMLAAVESLNETFTGFMGIADTLADDLGSGAVAVEDVEASLRQRLMDVSAIDSMAVAYAPQADLSSEQLEFVLVFRDENEEIVVQDGKLSLDFALPPGSDPDSANTPWTIERALQGPSWSEPFADVGTDKILMQYRVPIYSTDPATGQEVAVGIVALNSSITNMQELIDDLDMGQTGFGAVYSQLGTWLAHPVSELVAKSTIYDSPQFQNDSELLALAELAMEGVSDAIARVEPLTGDALWDYFVPIDSTGWVLLAEVAQAEYLPDATTILQEQTGIILVAALLLFVIITILIRVDRAQTRILWMAALSFSLIVLVVIVSLIVLSRQAPAQSGVTVINRTGVQSFLDNLQDEFVTKGMPPPLEIPTGVLIQSARFPDATSVVINGYIWQRIPKIEGVPINAGFTLPQMIDEPIQTEEIHREEREDETLIVWSFTASLRQAFDPLEYPFDRHDIKIRLLPTELQRFTILIPDFDAYGVTAPGFLPGVESDLRINNWNVLSSSFRFERQQYKTNIGIPGRPSQDVPELSFNIGTQRRFIGPFIAFLLPALVGAAMIFAFLLYDTKPDEPEEIVTALSYTAALFFVIAVMHTALRDDAAAIGLTYLEYLYLLLYVMVVFVAVNTFMVVKRPNHPLVQFQQNLLSKLLFWPVVATVMIIATLQIFIYG